MARILTVRPVPAYRRPLGYSLNGLKAWNTSLLFWGVGAGAAVTLLLSNTPIFKHDVLVKLPVVGEIWTDDTPAEDKPF